MFSSTRASQKCFTKYLSPVAMTNTQTSWSARAKRPRRLPALMNFPAQLASGRIHPDIRSTALLAACEDRVDFPFMDHIVSAIGIAQKLIDLPDDQPPFQVIGDGRNSRVQSINATAMVFHGLYRDTLTWDEIKEKYSAYSFSPYFDLFLRSRDEAAIKRLSQSPYEMTTPPENASSATRRAWFAHLKEVCCELNSSVDRIKQGGRKNRFREDVKTFRRVAHERRKSLTRLLLRVIDRVQSPRIVLFRLSGTHATYSPRTSRAQMTHYRLKLIRYFQRRLPEDLYRGYALLLKYSARYGYYLQAFVFFRDDVFRPPEALAGFIKNYWEENITGRNGRCMFNLLQDQVRFEAPAHYGDALFTAAGLTEADFYVQLKHEPSENPKKCSRAYWASRKLPAGQRKRIRSGTAAINRLRARKFVDPLLADAQAKAREEEMRLRELPD